ncbi:hypothetical protein BVRB_6g138010 [Beta vulgaris subsp. vulgaris]|nr:hypothetical protein BVRB_6g138010 [Beta vulgaris subsp. vulgaris]
MASHSLSYATFALSFIYFPYLIISQQPYGDSNCPVYNNASTALGYTCNANASQISAINNNISETMALATNTEVIVPVMCSCSGRFYQANATHVVRATENYYVITNIFGSLTTCNAIQIQKTSPNIINVYPNERLTIPLRCACPTTRQLNEGIRYLMTFVVQSGDAFWTIADKFGANFGQTLEANEKSEEDSVIQPSTTLLVPLQNPPNGSQMVYPPYVPPPPSSPPSLPPTTTPSPPSSNVSSSRRWAYFGVGVVAGGAFVAVAGIILFFVFLRASMRQKSDPILSSQNFEAKEKALVIEKQETETESLEFLESISKIASLKVYSFKDLQIATEDFSSDHWIKGSVYKGNVNGDEVAIKKMNGDVSKEISVLNKINHFNLVRLLGVCFEDGVWYFVYEFAGNGALSEWINEDKADGKTLSWGKRMQIACDVATGLNYLHSYTNPPHVHKDIKSSNVFLDKEFRAKIAKFGLSRPVRGNDGQFTLTKHIVGTKGYLAPEYLENGIVSPMLDVYAFGVLLLEMLTGKDVAYLYEGVNVSLSEILGPMLTNEDGISNMKEFVDTSLADDYPVDIAYSMLVLVDRCLRKDPGSRPTMDEVLQIVSKTLTTSLIWGSSTSASISSSA